MNAAAPRPKSGNQRMRGFTLLELTVALVLLALMASVMYGALGLAGQSSERGEAKVDATAGMRLAQEFLRAQLEGQHPLRMRKVAEFPLLFGGSRDELRYSAQLPSRVAAGGIWYYRLYVARDDGRAPLVLERIAPDVNAATIPEFTEPERSILAEGIADIHFSYFGRDAGADESSAPTWRDKWDNVQALPLLVRIEVTPVRGAAWPALLVAPREAPEAGCRSYDPARQVCVAV